MKARIFSIAIAGLVALGLAGLVACSSETEATTAEIKLPTMQCESCAHTISMAIKGIKGVKDVNVDVKAKTAKVMFASDQATVAKIEQAISKSGYAANDQKADPEAYAKLAECCKVGTAQ